MKILSVICARDGSKGLKNKCIKQIAGKMVIEYSIDYSLCLGENVETIVSTDIDKVIELCKRKNIEYINREPELCADGSRIEDVLADAIRKVGNGFEYCSLVYGNIPLRYEELFYEAVELLNNNKEYDAVFSMQEVEKYHPEWIFEYNKRILPTKTSYHYRRQMLPKKMIHDGHTAVFRIPKFLTRYSETKKQQFIKENMYSLFGDIIKPLVNDKIIVDIDSFKDFHIANALITLNRKKHILSKHR